MSILMVLVTSVWSLLTPAMSLKSMLKVVSRSASPAVTFPGRSILIAGIVNGQGIIIRQGDRRDWIGSDELNEMMLSSGLAKAWESLALVETNVMPLRVGLVVSRTTWVLSSVAVIGEPLLPARFKPC